MTEIRPFIQPPAAQVVLDAMPNPLLVLDSNDNICMVNTAAEDFFQSGAVVLRRVRRHGQNSIQ